MSDAPPGQISSHNPAPPGSRKGALAVLSVLLFLGSLVIAAAVGEIAIRWLAPQQLILLRPDIWVARDTVGWFRRPNVAASINTGERTVDIFTDAQGFRVGKAGRIEAPTRVLLIGDSFVEALQVPYESSLAGLLEARLSGRLGRPVAVRNAGVAGWDPNQYLLETRAALARDSFALVVVSVYVGNDLVKRRIDHFEPRSPIARHHFHIPTGWGWQEMIDAAFYPINDALEVRSQLFIFLKSQFQTVLMRLGLTESYVPLGIRRRESRQAMWALTADVLRDLDRVANAEGVPALFVLVPAPQQVDPGIFAQYLAGFGLDSADIDLDQPSRRLALELGARKLPVLDLLTAFRQAATTGTPLYGSVDPHLSPRGHELLERLIEEPVVATLTMRTSSLDSGARSHLPVPHPSRP